MRNKKIVFVLTFFFISLFASSGHALTPRRDNLIDTTLDHMEISLLKQKRRKIIKLLETTKERESQKAELQEITQTYIAPEPRKILQKTPLQKTHTKKRRFSAEINPSIGYRIDDIDWTIAGSIDGSSPNILSELIWNNLEIFQIKTDATVTINENYVLDGMIAFGDIEAGENRDSDYDGNNRTLEFSRSNNQSNDGETFDFSVGFGYKFNLNKYSYLWPDFTKVDHLWITPLIGYSYHEQNLVITDGFQTLPATGAFSSILHSTYDTEWKGPWLGFELQGDKNRLTSHFRFEYHIVDFYAEADWNLRTDFQHPKSFEHEAEGKGIIFDFGVGYKAAKNWNLNVTANIQNWQTDEGIDRTFFSSGASSATQLNEVNWESYALMLGATYSFH